MAQEVRTTPKVEVNLVPMIDIMFQLIAFFTMLINLDNAKNDERVRLPVADLAKPSEMAIDEMLTLNVNRSGMVNVGLGGDQLLAAQSEEFRQYLVREAAQAQKNMKQVGRTARVVDGRPELWTTVMIRADREVENGVVQSIMRMCRELGFVKFALRATAEQTE